MQFIFVWRALLIEITSTVSLKENIKLDRNGIRQRLDIGFCNFVLQRVFHYVFCRVQ